MKNFSISDLERLSGIKAHTLRTWEIRHSVLKPQRGTANTRFYSLSETEYILNLSILNRNGYKISSLLSLTPAELKEKIRSLADNEIKQQKVIVDLIVFMHSLSIEQFENTLSECFNIWSAKEVLNHIIYPFLKLNDLLWQGNQLTEEHLVVTALRSKIIYAIERTGEVERINRIVLLFLPNNKQLDLALLYMCFHLKNAGVQVVYMGSDVSIENLETVFEKIHPHFLFTYLPNKNNFQYEKLINLLNSLLPNTKLILTISPRIARTTLLSDKILFLNYEEALRFLIE